MRNYNNMQEMINETIRDVFVRGQTVFDPTWQGIKVDKVTHSSKEVIGYSFKVVNTNDKEDSIRDSAKYFNKDSSLSLHEAKEWSKNRLKGMWMNQPSSKINKEYWKIMREKYDLFSYTYEERMVYLPYLIYLLKQNKYMRGCCLTIYETTRDLSNIGRRRVPCSMYYQFLIRDTPEGEKLHLIYNMRSCDLANHFAMDMYCASVLKDYVAKEVGVKSGDLIVNINSLHVFLKDVPGDKKW